MKKDVVEWCKRYFCAFASKNLSALKEIYDENVALFDWEQSVTGKNAVLEANQSLFEKVDSIEVEVTEVHVADWVAACQITIIINYEQKLKVLDLITWNPQGQILKVDAYRQ